MNTQALDPKEEKIRKSEQEILQLKEDYILLGDAAESVLNDITDSFFKKASQLKVGSSFDASDFNLLDTMGASELDHPKMDSYYQYKKINTLKKGIKQGIMNPLNSLTLQEELSIIDNLLVKECQWLSGSSSNQTIFSLVYFHNQRGLFDEKDSAAVGVVLNSYKHLCYIFNYLISNATSIREEEFIPNFGILEVKSISKSIKECENRLIERRKTADESIKGVITSILLRLKYRKELIQFFDQSIDKNNQFRFDDYNERLRIVKDSFAEIEKEFITSNEKFESSLKLAEKYFVPEITRIIPINFQAKYVAPIKLAEVFALIKKTISEYEEVGKIIHLKEYFAIKKSLEVLNSKEPVPMVRGLIDYLICSSSKPNSLLNNLEFISMIETMFPEIKFNIPQPILTNIFEVLREILINNLRIKSRAMRITPQLIGSLFIVAAELNNSFTVSSAEEFFKSKDSVLPHVLKKIIMQEALNHITMEMKSNIYSAQELDYIFFVQKVLSEGICQIIDFLLSKFAGKILKENDFVKSNLKKKLSFTQKMLMDELHVFNGYKYAFSALFAAVTIIKESELISYKEKPELEEARINNRFSGMNGLELLAKFDYQNFKMYKQSFKDLNKADIAENLLKSSEHMLKELKSADIKLRNEIYYNDDFLSNNIKSLMFNRLLVGKLKKGGLKAKTVIPDFYKYSSQIPLLELKEHK